MVADLDFGLGTEADPAYKSDRVTGSWATPKKGAVQNVLTTPPPPPPLHPLHYRKSTLKFH